MKPIILKGHTRPLTRVKYNYEGDLLFSCAKDNKPTVWYSDNGERLGTFDGHKGTVWCLDVDIYSDYLLTCGGDGTLIVWRVKNGKQIIRFSMGGGPIRSGEWAEGGMMFTCCSDRFMQQPGKVFVFNFDRAMFDNEELDEPLIWDESNAECSWEIPDIEDKVTVISWGTLNEYLMTGSDGGVLRVHDPFTGEVLRKVAGHSARINSLQWNKSKTLCITGGSDCVALLWDVENWEVIKRYESSTPVNAAAISPIKEHVFVAGGQEAMNVTTTSSRVGNFETKLFHMVFGDEFGSIKGHFGPVNTLAIHPDGTGFVSGSEDGYIRVHSFDKDYYLMHNEYDDLEAVEELIK